MPKKNEETGESAAKKMKKQENQLYVRLCAAIFKSSVACYYLIVGVIMAGCRNCGGCPAGAAAITINWHMQISFSLPSTSVVLLGASSLARSSSGDQ